METYSLLNSISNKICEKVKKYVCGSYKMQWLNERTDLSADLKMSDLQIINLLLELEKEYKVEITAIPIMNLNFKIIHISKLIEFFLTPDNVVESNLLNYALKNVEIYKQMDRTKIKKISDVVWNEEFHKGGTEFSSIADNYYSTYVYGGIIYRREVGASGKFTFSLKTYFEKIVSELQLWRKRKSWYNIKPDSRKINFISNNYVGNRIAYPEKRGVLKNRGLELEICESLMDSTNIEQYLREFEEFSPDWVCGDCSTIFNLCMGILKHKIHLKMVKYIEVISDNNIISEDMRDIIIEAFENVQISSVIHNPHVGAFLITCPKQHLHQVSNSTMLSFSEQESEQFTDIFLSDLLSISAPVLNTNSYIRGQVKRDTMCKFEEESEMIIDLAPTISFDGFIDSKEWSVSAGTITMCIELVNAEYNHPFSTIQIVQEERNCVQIYLAMDSKFNGWEKTLASSILSNLNKWASDNMEWKIIILDECHPCEYTGVLSYYNNHSM